MRKVILTGLSVLLMTLGLWSFNMEEDALEEGTPLYINGIALYKDGFLASEKGTGSVCLYSMHPGNGTGRIRQWKTEDEPTGVTTDGKTIYATTGGARGGAVVIHPEKEEPQPLIPTGRGACSPVINANGTKLYVCNQFQTTVSEIDLQTQKVTREVSVLREPKNAILTSDEKYLLVANFLPVGRANQDSVSSAVSVIALSDFQKIKDIPLATGSNALRGMTLSNDGRYAFVTHNLGRFQAPTSQLQQGWMNTSAMSVIDLQTMEYGGAVLLDEADRGAAGIWDVKCTDGQIIITHSGTHEISIIDYNAFVQKYTGVADKSSLAYDLRFLVGLRQRIPVKGNGPRNFAVDDEYAFVPTYFSDTLNTISLKSPSESTTAALVHNRVENARDKGEKYFNDASYCFQNWQSCNGCHPGDGRNDGLNWDLLNDGIGNPKNCKSMLYAHQTAPCMISGVREDAEHAVRAGFKYIQFHEVPEEIATCVDEYLKSLEPVPSPYLVNGELSEKAKKGQAVFKKYSCDYCHSGPHYTDQCMHRIGQDVEFEKGWDTPTLKEVWRTAPYLFDGRAATMEEVFTVHKHGLEGKKITQEEKDELIEYVNSL